MDETQVTDAAPTETAQPDAPATPAAAPETKKRNRWCSKDDGAYPLVLFKWIDGTVTTVDTSSYPEEVRNEAILHGFKQKLGDGFSGAKSLDEAKAMFQKVLDTLNAKGWTGRADSVPAEPEEPVEVLAQAVFHTLTEDGKQPDFNAVLAQVKAADRKTRNLWRGVDRVAFHVARLKSHTQTPTLDAFRGTYA